jgi:hypothetical protein
MIQCGICGCERGNGTRFTPSTLVFASQYISTNAPQSHFIHLSLLLLLLHSLLLLGVGFQQQPFFISSIAKTSKSQQLTVSLTEHFSLSHLSTNPTSITLGLNPGLHSGTPMSNHLTYVIAMVTYVIPLLQSMSFRSIISLHGFNTT